MKILKYISIFTLVLILFSSCEDNLNTLPEGNKITTSQKEDVAGKDPKKAEAGVNAIFSQLNAYQPNYTALGVGRHNDFGYPSIMLFADANYHDFVGETNGYNWVSNSIEYGDRNFSSNEAIIVWNNLYSYIKTANNVIAAIDMEVEDALSKYYLAQGLAMRAFSYNVLAQLYQFKYKGNEQKPGVPLITHENEFESSNEGMKRSTLQEVYNLVLSDLDKAISLLESAQANKISRADKRYIDLSVAYGLRARVNLAMENWKEAAEDAASAIDASSAKPASIENVSKPSFKDASESNWMWGIVIAETDRTVTSGIVNWISHMGSLNYGYANFSGGFQINKTLYHQIDESDIRKNWWINEEFVDSEGEEGYDIDYLTPAMEEFIIDYEYPAYTQVKFAPYNNEVETTTNANDIPLMRIEEMYLILAEAQAMSGDVGGGANTLSDFVKTYRNKQYSFAGGGAKELQDEVFFQKRLELWGEGLIWYDVKRLEKDVDRRGAGYEATMVYNIKANDPALLWMIPEAEIIANPKLSNEDNNPTVPRPTAVKDIE